MKKRLEVTKVPHSFLKILLPIPHQSSYSCKKTDFEQEKQERNAQSPKKVVTLHPILESDGAKQVAAGAVRLPEKTVLHYLQCTQS